MDKHLAILAARHMETKFVRVHAEKAPFLTGWPASMLRPSAGTRAAAVRAAPTLEAGWPVPWGGALPSGPPG